MINPNENKIKQAFERPQWYLTKTGYNIRIRVETVKKFVNGREINNILDIGCGDGSLSLPLLNPGRRLTLLDRSKTMLDIASSRIPEGCHVDVRNEDFIEAQLPEHGFDLILCVGVLAYVDNLKLFLERIASLLAPGGTAIVECSDGAHFIRRLYLAYDALRRKVGMKWFQTVIRPSSEVLATLENIGFEVRSCFRYSQPFPIARRLLPQDMIYKAIHLIFGDASRSRASWLGSECIFFLRQK